MTQNYQEVLGFKQNVVDFLGGMKFTTEEMLGTIGKFSGGQKANLLVLDKPTRNFSPFSALEIRRTLNEFNGAIISISHGRKYLAQVCQKVYTLTSDGLLWT